MPESTQQIVNKISAALKADPRKTGLMSVLAAVLITIVGRMLLGGERPSGALASLLQTPHTNVAGTRPINASRNAAALAQWRAGPAVNMGRNLFTTRLEYFPADNSKSAVGAEGDFWSQLGKSITQATDEENKRENLKENFRQQAGKLRLQSTMAGPQPRAILNGQLVSEGSVVENFRVARIESRKVILEREGLRFELGMSK